MIRTILNDSQGICHNSTILPLITFHRLIQRSSQKRHTVPACVNCFDNTNMASHQSPESQWGFADCVTETTISFACFVPPSNGHISMSGHQKVLKIQYFLGRPMNQKFIHNIKLPPCHAPFPVRRSVTHSNESAKPVCKTAPFLLKIRPSGGSDA